MNKRTKLTTSLNLGLMIFMQYLPFAIWWVPLAAYLANLNMNGMQRSLILSSMAIGSIASPIIGMLADRHFASEKVLAMSNLLTAILLFVCTKVTAPNALLAVIILTMLCYMTSWSLTAAIAMAHTSSEQFPRIRVFGSIGWVASGLFGLVAVRNGWEVIPEKKKGQDLMERVDLQKRSSMKGLDLHMINFLDGVRNNKRDLNCNIEIAANTARVWFI